MMYSPHRNGNRITGANIHNTKQHSLSMSTLSITLWYKLAAEHSGFVGENPFTGEFSSVSDCTQDAHMFCIVA